MQQNSKIKVDAVIVSFLGEGRQSERNRHRGFCKLGVCEAALCVPGGGDLTLLLNTLVVFRVKLAKLWILVRVFHSVLW